MVLNGTTAAVQCAATCKVHQAICSIMPVVICVAHKLKASWVAYCDLQSSSWTFATVITTKACCELPSISCLLCRYVVLSGTCHVRARPLKLPNSSAAADALTLPTSSEPTSVAAAVCNASSQSGSTPAAAAPVYSSVGSHSSVRRTTWEGAAFTPQEQAKLEAVNAVLDADKRKVCAQAGRQAGRQYNSLND